MPDIAVIDYGMGNLHSVRKALEHVAPGAEVVVTGTLSRRAANGQADSNGLLEYNSHTPVTPAPPPDRNARH